MSHKKQSSIIASRVTKKVSLFSTILYFLIMIGILVVLVPVINRLSDAQVRSSLSLMKNSVQDVQDFISSDMNGLYTQKELLTALAAYSQAPTESAKANVEIQLSSFVDNNPCYLAVSVEDSNHNFASSNRCREQTGQEHLKNDSVYQNLFDTKVGSYFSSYPAGFFWYSNNYAISITEQNCLAYTQAVTFNGQFYVIRLYYQSDNLLNSLRLQSADHMLSYWLYYKQTVLFSSGDDDQMTSFSPETYPISITPSKVRVSGGYLYYVDILSSSSLRLAAFVSYSMIYKELLLLPVVFVLLFLVSLLTYSLVLSPMIKNALLPVRRLHDSMQEYTIGQTPFLDIHTGDEIETLSEIYVDMTKKINQQYLELGEKEHINAVTNYKLLATQIDPHFIYNTMNVITILARQGNMAAVESLNSALIQLMRARLSSKLSVFTTIEKELEMLLQYELIMHYRYESRVKLHYDVDPDLRSYVIPINILQPLAENSFYHGFATLPSDQEGHMDLTIYAIEDHLEIEFTDDGSGIPADRLQIIMSKSYEIYKDEKPHIGIDNIRQRLDYLYHSDHSFDIHSEEGYGTTVCISIPLWKEIPAES